MSRCPEAAIRGNWPMVCAELVAAGQGRMRSLAAAIGTLAIETASTFAPVEEAFWLSPGARIAEYEKHGYGGGQLYHGRGYIQLTHNYNYLRVGNAIGVDLITHPDLALDPVIAAKAFARYWADRDIQAIADREDWLTVRKAVVGYVTHPPGFDRLRQIATDLMQRVRP